MLDELLIDNILNGIDFQEEIRNKISEKEILDELERQFRQFVQLGIISEEEYELLKSKLSEKIRKEKEKFEFELEKLEPVISEESDSGMLGFEDEDIEKEESMEKEEDENIEKDRDIDSVIRD